MIQPHLVFARDSRGNKKEADMIEELVSRPLTGRRCTSSHISSPNQPKQKMITAIYLCFTETKPLQILGSTLYYTDT